ncbi:MAG: hypothetical protein WC485_08065 [Opitutaceae bacterium]
MTPLEAVSLDKAGFRKWVKEANEEDLQDVFDHMSPASTASKWKIAETEIARRRHRDLKKTPWYKDPIFWVTLAAAIFAAISAVSVLFR